MFTRRDWLRHQLEVWRLIVRKCPTFNLLLLLLQYTRTHLSNSLKLLTNKENGKSHIPLSEKLHWKKKNPLHLFNKSKFIWRTDKEKWRAFFQGMHSIWQQFGGIVYFGPTVWSMIDDRRENHEPLAWAQTCKLLSADCCILLDIYQVVYSMPPYLQPGSSWSIPLKEGGRGADVVALLGESRNPWGDQLSLYTIPPKETTSKIIPNPHRYWFVLKCNWQSKSHKYKWFKAAITNPVATWMQWKHWYIMTF